MPAPKDPIKYIEWIENIKKSLRGKMAGVENPFFGKKHTLKDKKKMRDSYILRKSLGTLPIRKKYNHTLETRKLMSEQRKGCIPWNKGLKFPNFHSEETKKKLSEIHKGIKMTDEWKKNLSISAKKREMPFGEKHPRWIKDRTKLVFRTLRSMNRSEYSMWRNKVFKRDNWTCKIKDINCKGQLEAHHILPWKDYPELRLEINNGITLCHAHHPRKRNEVTMLSPYFKELINSHD